MKRRSRKPPTPNIVSIRLSPATKRKLDQVCEQRGMTIKSLLGRLIAFLHAQSKTEQAIILGQIDLPDRYSLAELVLHREGHPSLRATRKRRKNG